MQVNLAEFSKELPIYLKLAGAGEVVFIVSHSKPIARLMPPSDETAYLLSSPANAKRLKRAKKEIEKGNLTEIENIDDLDKLVA